MHPTFPVVGENIWTGTARIFSVDAALMSWFNEVNSYDFSTNTCTDKCGHYTQVSLTCPVLYSLIFTKDLSTGLEQIPLEQELQQSFAPPSLLLHEIRNKYYEP